jgi:hypothetical protein
MGHGLAFVSAELRVVNACMSFGEGKRQQRTVIPVDSHKPLILAAIDAATKRPP